MNSISFNPDGTQFVSGSDDTFIRLWDSVNGDELDTYSGHTDAVLDVAFSPDGRTIASGSDDTTIRLWNVTTGEAISTIVGHSQAVWGVAFSSTGQYLFSGSSDRTIVQWDLALLNEEPPDLIAWVCDHRYSDNPTCEARR